MASNISRNPNRNPHGNPALFVFSCVRGRVWMPSPGRGIHAASMYESSTANRSRQRHFVKRDKCIPRARMFLVEASKCALDLVFYRNLYKTHVQDRRKKKRCPAGGTTLQPFNLRNLCARKSVFVDDVAHLEDGQKHADHNATDYHAEENNQKRLNQRRQTGENGFNLLIQKV
jgi:hypothetical protein